MECGIIFADIFRTSVQSDSPFAPLPAGLRRTKLRDGGRSLRLGGVASVGRLTLVSFRALSLVLNRESPRFGASSVPGVVVTSSLGAAVGFVRRWNVRFAVTACGIHDH